MWHLPESSVPILQGWEPRVLPGIGANQYKTITAMLFADMCLSKRGAQGDEKEETVEKCIFLLIVTLSDEPARLYMCNHCQYWRAQ